ncbi:MAG: aminoglycoside 6-adenylyltransferase [Chloroflexi bacterium]|nr:aminoglycoside 6-adenylyltransferase [Chloroflexota bacterium]MCI0580368.1 aminoglycoside 6-adenylyltransferase [Chloroflexota bacterium]MCI0649520.1 aminoglycoside 6-adenylyltransferase [Chloroflexota bacterium]MCI0726051.1 aminoglycoside 6-adenylyltransferase [Chloroflexota bacterium]
MDYWHDSNEVIGRLVAWGEEQGPVRAMLLTSTRAIPGGPVDALSDYDVVLVVTDIRPFFEDRGWLEDFGRVLVVYWDPIYQAPGYGIEQTANVTQYEDGLKIDFTLWPVELLRRMAAAPALPAELDAGYRVLLDKDGVTEGMKGPTYRGYLPERPSEERYRLVVEEFFSDAPYVAKCLWRGELMPAKWALDYDMKHVYLRQVLEWRVEVDHNWSAKVGALGKGLKRWLPADIWGQLESTYVGAGVEENWEALFKTITLFRQVATEVGTHLGYAYPHELDRRVRAYLQKVKGLDH